MQKPMSSNPTRGAHEAGHPPARRRLVLPLVSLACMLASGSAALAQEAPPLDEDLQFLLDNGFESFIFAQTCRSIGAAGDGIDGEPLPVGGGRQLECETATVGHLQTIDTLASTGERFCALGQVSSIEGDGDPRLAVSVASSPDGAPWGLVGTHDGEEITIGRITGPGGGTAWPLWADAIFDVIALQPNPTAQLCDDVFGL
jgi:hypothetical protein